MEYRKYGDTVYVRMDRGDETVGEILDICETERITYAVFSGIGGCSEAQILTAGMFHGRYATAFST